MREEQIKILENAQRFLDQDGWAEYADALTDAISYIRDTSEMLEAAGAILFKEYPTILRLLGGEWGTRTGPGYQDVHYSGGPLEAWREVKEKR